MIAAMTMDGNFPDVKPKEQTGGSNKSPLTNEELAKSIGLNPETGNTLVVEQVLKIFNKIKEILLK